MDTLSVNATIERFNELVGTDVAIFGQLSLDFEGHCIWHLPRSERSLEYDSGLYASSMLFVQSQIRKLIDTATFLRMHPAVRND